MTQAEGSQRSIPLCGLVSRFSHYHTKAWGQTGFLPPGPSLHSQRPFQRNSKWVGFSAGSGKPRRRLKRGAMCTVPAAHPRDNFGSSKCHHYAHLALQ